MKHTASTTDSRAFGRICSTVSTSCQGSRCTPPRLRHRILYRHHCRACRLSRSGHSSRDRHDPGREGGRGARKLAAGLIDPRRRANTSYEPVDAIVASAGATHPLHLWLDALRSGGRLLFPMTTFRDGPGAMLLVTRGLQDGFAARFLCRAGFIDF
jgi:hypothetical protein